MSRPIIISEVVVLVRPQIDSNIPTFVRNCPLIQLKTYPHSFRVVSAKLEFKDKTINFTQNINSYCHPFQLRLSEPDLTVEDLLLTNFQGQHVQIRLLYTII